MKVKPTYKELLKYVCELENKVCDLERKLTESMEKSEKLKCKLLGNVSHEMRTPMNAILGFSNLLIDKNITHDKREEYMEHINQSSASLLRLVDTMIDASLLEINELRIHREDCNVGKMLQQVYYYCNIERHKTNKDHLALLLNVDKKVNDMIIYTDQYRLTQVLFSLINNAFKFTSKGIIEFGCFLKDENNLQFYVKDSGKGISVDKVQAVFRKFEKQDEDYGHVEGLGLGLALSKGIINLLDGEIWVEKNVLNGSTFYFTLKYKEKEDIDIKEKEDIDIIKKVAGSVKGLIVSVFLNFLVFNVL